jgi:uncharacterized damage-inducible protein DinB
MADGLTDPRRVLPAFDLAERAMLEGWLEFHRVTLLLKCEDLSDEQRKARSVRTSVMSLHGIVRHMAEVERGWFGRVLLQQRDLPFHFYDEAIEDSDFGPLDSADWDADCAVWLAECDASRQAAASHTLEDAGTTKSGEACTLRWIYTHMIEEYARHNGHADLLRELAGGSIGV